MTHKAYILKPKPRLWECPNCDVTAVKVAPLNHQEFHNCAGLAGLSVPMVEHGVKAKVSTNEREDYVGKEKVTTDDNNRPIMNVIIERDNGNDCFVYAPVAEVSEGGK